jgi:homoserine dehydrogenase
MPIDKKQGIILVGCGTVGGGTALILKNKIPTIRRKTGLPLELKYIVDVNFDHARSIGLDDELFQSDLNMALEDPEVTIVVELVGGTGFAKTVFEKSLAKGKHVITANKALLAEYGEELFALARENQVGIGLEASCGGGIPIVQTLVEDLMANDIDGLYGILNGTCNYILTEMLEKGRPFDLCLKEAQELGLAEADPTLDISGMDTAHKLTIMGSLAFQKTFKLDDIPVKGIQEIYLLDVQLGQQLGYVLKLIAFAEIQNGEPALWVAPAFIPHQHPLAVVSGAFNAVSVYGHAVGHTLYYGRGAGASPTASAVVGDIINAASGHLQFLQTDFQVWPGQTPPAEPKAQNSLTSPFYLRIKGADGLAEGLKSQIAALGQAGSHQDSLGNWAVVTQRINYANLSPILDQLAAAEIEVQVHPIVGDRQEFTSGLEV